MKGIYFHGLESTNKGSKILYTQKKYNVYAPSIDYKYLNQFKEFSVSVDFIAKDDYDFVIGSSMGGYVAYNYAIRYNVPMLLLNPSLIYDNNKHPFDYQFNEDLVKQYDKHCVVLFGVDDKVVNPNITKQVLTINYDGYDLKCGHRIPLEMFKPHLESFIKTI